MATQYSCLGNPMDRRRLVGYNPRGCKELDIIQRWRRIQHVNTEVVCNRHARGAMPAGENKRVARERGENQERRQRTTVSRQRLLRLAHCCREDKSTKK